IAEGADPDLGSKVDAGERVEGGGASLAAERGVLKAGDVRVGADEGDGGCQRDDAFARFHLGAGPHVPRHAHSVHSLGIWARHLRHPRSLTRGGTGNSISLRNNSLSLSLLQFSILITINNPNFNRPAFLCIQLLYYSILLLLINFTHPFFIFYLSGFFQFKFYFLCTNITLFHNLYLLIYTFLYIIYLKN
ncbi:hypothetical protein V8G54_020783, partial [Vigna mungo]